MATTNDLTHSMTVTKADGADLVSLPRGSYIQENDGFYNWVDRPGRFLLCSAGSTAGRDWAQLDFPVTIHFIPNHTH